MKISGKGSIDGGVYNEEIHVVGMAAVSGGIKCTAVNVNGSLKVSGELSCDGAVDVSGLVNTDGAASAGGLKVNGNAVFGGALTVKSEVDISGKISVGADLKCVKLISSGDTEIKGGIEADAVAICGNIECSGLVNADVIELHPARSGNKVFSIGGGVITVIPDKVAAFVNKTPLLTKLVGGKIGVLEVEESIEGDEVTLEFVKCPEVSGRIVKIGKGCEIGHVKYSEEAVIDQEASVTLSEKV